MRGAALKLILVHGLGALPDVAYLPHPQGFSHCLLFFFLFFPPIFNPMLNSSSISQHFASLSIFFLFLFFFCCEGFLIPLYRDFIPCSATVL